MINNQLFKQFKNELLKQKFLGSILYDQSNRIINATDNSIYEVMPLAVIQPKNEQDVELLCKIANYKEFESLSFTARGGGTGTNGQALTSGIVVDMSRYMTNILDFSQTERTITVEPGVVLSQLNKYLAEYGLFFAPNVSTENRATIGGMIANDSAGKGSLVYGKTNEHVLELSCVLIDGSKLDIYSITHQQLKSELEKSTQLGVLSQEILSLVSQLQDEINKKFAPLKRPLSGYNLKSFYDGNNIDLTKIITGSEGTLAFITKAKLKLLPIPQHKALVVTHYNSFLQALDNVEFLLKHNPLAIETVDEIVQKNAATLPSWSNIADLMGVSVTENSISNFSEFVDDEISVLDEKLNKLEIELQQRQMRYKIVRNSNHIKQLWSIRSLAVGLIGKIPGEKKPVAFVEDALVLPQHLSNFVADFRQLLDGYGMSYAMYGHSDVGCVHVRPLLDMKLDDDRNKIRLITEEVVKLTDKYQGLLWGEHGKGYRGEFVEHTFGDILYPVLQKIKALFDPYNRLNPGKLVTPYNDKSSVTKIDSVVMRGELDQHINVAYQDEFYESMLCNGNAACFNVDSNNVMCPSYKVTKDRIHSPKGRAMLVKEWLRNKSLFGATDIKTVESANNAVNALQGCLGCKGCSGKCPTSVSIPDLKTKFYNEYYKKHKKRSLKEKVLENLEKIVLIGAKFPRLWNFFIKNKLHPSFGIINAPLMSKPYNLKTALEKDNITLYNDDIDALKKLKNPVVILSDVFTGFLDCEVLIATCRVLKAVGYIPVVIYPVVSGKSLVVAGNLDKFKKTVINVRNKLSPIFANSIPVVGLENSITLMYRDEYKKFGDGLSGTVSTLAEFLSLAIQDEEASCGNKPGKDYYILPHCTEQAICPNDARLWQLVFRKLNLNCNVINLGCCGMAGYYGHELQNQENSKKLFEMHWSGVLNDQPKFYMATGYSCRSQAKLLADYKLAHPIQVVSEYIDNATSTT